MHLPRPDAQSFDHLPEHYDRFAELVGGALDAYLAARVPGRGRRAVDLGCGTGRHAAFLATRFEQVLAVDCSAPMLTLARRRRPLPNLTYERRDLTEVRADRDGTFDLVFSAYALHHVPDLDAALERIRGLVAPRGQAILVDIANPAELTDGHGLVPRARFVEEAAREYAADLAGGRRPLAEAAELLALSLDPAWLDHVTTDRTLTPAEFTRRYLAALPGAVITELPGRAFAVHYAEPT